MDGKDDILKAKMPKEDFDSAVKKLLQASPQKIAKKQTRLAKRKKGVNILEEGRGKR